jgi:biopolymer transport protein ExbB
MHHLNWEVIQVGGLTIWKLFQLGGPVMWPLLAASVLGLAVILDRVCTFVRWRQKFDVVVNTLQPWILCHAWDKAAKLCQQRGPFTRMAAVYVQQRHLSKEVRDDLLRREGLIILGHLSNHLRWLAVLAQVSTLLGLLGTFHVMITRFAQGELAGGTMLPAHFSSAIWEALLTTMYGLLIAIPCAATYQMLEDRVDAIARQMDILVSYLDEWRRQAEVQQPKPDDDKVMLAMPKTGITFNSKGRPYGPLPTKEN